MGECCACGGEEPDGLGNWDGAADPSAFFGSVDEGVDADDLAVIVEEWSAGVAGVDAGVVMDGAAVKLAHHAGGQGFFQDVALQGAADGDDLFAYQDNRLTGRWGEKR